MEKTIGNWKENPEVASMATTIDYLMQMTAYLGSVGINEKITILQNSLVELNKFLSSKGEDGKDFDKGEVMLINYSKYLYQ